MATKLTSFKLKSYTNFGLIINEQKIAMQIFHTNLHQDQNL